MLCIHQLVGQTVVTGTVSDEDDEPLVGVNVLLKGTTKGTVTDLGGLYTITTEGPETVLQFSYIGHESQEEVVGTRGQINITLLPDAKTLSEITVVGYGSQRRSDLTGAITSIRAEEISSFPIARVDQALQGKSSGVYVLNTDGSPGGNALIRIRGSNSINGGNEPLVVIDGLQGGNLNSLNPNDIQSIEILKDASATAIYGSRGANGVILVTTKLGREGKPVIDAGYNVGFQSLLRKLPVMNAGEYARLYNLIRSTQTGDGNVPVPVFTDQQIAGFDANGGTDWQDVVYEIGVIQNAQLGMSGGSKNLKYLISGNYLNHQGILINSGYTRASLRANLTAEISKAVEFGINWNFTKENATSPSFKREVAFVEQVVNIAPRWAPTEPVYNEDGSYFRHRSYGASDTWNPLASAVEPKHDNPLSRNNASMYLDFKLLDGLSFRVVGGALLEDAFRREYQNQKTLTGLQNNGRGIVSESISQRYQNSNILTYDKTWSQHHFTFTGLFEQIWEEYEENGTNATNFLVDDLGYDNLGGATSLNVWSVHNKRALSSYMGRINYVLADKYLLTASFRADASSVFGDDHKWGYFPSASVAWRLSEESFMQELGSFDLKIRASWGKTGNQGISPYQSLARLSSGGDLLYPSDGGTTTNIGFGIGGLANPDLRWETTTQTNLGVDLSFYGGRLTSTIDIYKKVTDDLLMPRELPGYVGVPSVLDNIGSVENKGLELTVGGDPIIGDFSWNTSVNLTINRNKVLDLGADDRIAFNTTRGGYNLRDFMVLQVGESFGTMTGYVFEGIWGTSEAEEARSYGQLPGMAKYKDIDGDGDVDLDDRTIIGNGYPDYSLGWTNSFNYKGWGFSFMILSFQGVDLFNQLRIRREVQWEGNDPRMLNYWTPENQNTDMPGYLDQKYVQDQQLKNKYFLDGNESSRYVEDASFIRLKTVQLSHNFNQPWLTKSGIRHLRVFASATNPFTITDYTGYDPEVAAFPENDANVGVDFSAYPPSKTYTVGVEVSF
ncbi:MAG: TonB-dependent receptor [Saprospiraceae bacterium]|nr:TonB-dependent receptor [Saprospiraceae bacterium]